MLHRQYLKAAIKAGLPIVALSLAGKNSLKNKPVYENSLGKDILYTARAAMDGMNAGVAGWGAMPESLINEATGGKLNAKTGILDSRDEAEAEFRQSLSKVEREPLKKLAELGYYVPEMAMLQGRSGAGMKTAGKLLSKENAARIGLYDAKRLDENMQAGMDFEPALVNATIKAAVSTAQGRSGEGRSVPFNMTRSGGAGAANSVVNNLTDKMTGKKKNMRLVSGDEKEPAVFNLPQMRDGAARSILGSGLTNSLKGKGSVKGTDDSKKIGKNKSTTQKSNTSPNKTKQGIGRGLNATYENILKQKYEQSKRKK